MLYLSGAKNTNMRSHLADGTVGFLQTPGNGHSLDGVAVWAMDNGCYTGTYPGDDAYMALLERLEPHRDRCLFVAVPDVVGDAEATLALFAPMARRIRDAGWPVALVAQDGMTSRMVPWDDLDWLFIGGSTDFKMSPAVDLLIDAALRRDTEAHIVRHNSWSRFQHFAAIGADTADGTFIAFGPDRNLPQVMGWMSAPVQTRLGGI